MHIFEIGDTVRSEISGRKGEVVDCTDAIVRVEFQDIHSNVDYAEAPDAWVPHAALQLIKPVSFQ